MEAEAKKADTLSLSSRAANYRYLLCRLHWSSEEQGCTHFLKYLANTRILAASASNFVSHYLVSIDPAPEALLLV